MEDGEEKNRITGFNFNPLIMGQTMDRGCGDLFPEAVSTEQGPIPETHMHRGRENRMDKSLLSRSALVNLSLCGMFLAPTG